MMFSRFALALVVWIVAVVLLVVPPVGAQQIASLMHDTFMGDQNALVQVDADTFALAYAGQNQDGYIKTFTVSADGATITEVNSVVYDTSAVWYNSFVRVDADTFALSYSGSGDDGYIKTFTISADGALITEEDSLEHDPELGEEGSLVWVDGDTYALAYRGVDYDGFIKTFTISPETGLITPVNSLEHDTSYGGANSLVWVDGDTFALAYRKSYPGYIKTFTISADGLTITQKDVLEHEVVRSYSNSLVRVDADTVALAYPDGGEDGFIKTFTISAVDQTITEVSSLEHDSVSGRSPSLVQVDADTFGLAYAGDGSDGYVKIFRISADGATITEEVSLEHDTTYAWSNSLVHVAGGVCALAYRGDGNKGYIKTFDLSAIVIFIDGFESGDSSAW